MSEVYQSSINMNQAEEAHQPKVSVVLGSGGLKPIASVALFDLLKEEQIPVDLLLGCSGGSIYGAMYAMGYQTDEMIEITKSFLEDKGFSAYDYQSILSIGNLPGGKFDLSRGLLKQEAALKNCGAVFKDTLLEELPIKTMLQTTNIQTGEGVLLEKGLLAEAVYASAAMYPIISPLYMDGRWLADGAYSEPLPITKAVVNKSDIIISMVFNEQVMSKPRGFLDSFYNISRVYTQALTRSQLAMAINLHHYEMIIISPEFKKPFSFDDPSNIDELVEIGRQAVEVKRDEILTAISNYSK